MATKKLLTNGNAFKRTDGRWGGTVWYMDESGERKRKCFSGTTKQEVNKKMTAYIEDFFDVGCRNVADDFISDQGIYLVFNSTLIPIIGCPFY